MSLVWNPRTRNWEADIRKDGGQRLHVSLRTKLKGKADDRHSAVKAMFLEGNADLIAALRSRKIGVEAITRAHQDKKPFESLIVRATWPTIRAATDDYMAALDQQTEIAPGTRVAAKQLLESAVIYFGADRGLETISHEEVEAWKLALLARGLQGWTVAQYLTRLGTLYKWVMRREERRAAREGRSIRVLHSPVEREIVPPRSEPRKRFLSLEEAQQLIAATPERLLFAVGAGLWAGLRIGEVCTLRPIPQDINLEVAGGGIILVQKKDWLKGSRKMTWRPKSRKAREIPIASALRPIIELHAEKYASAAWFMAAPHDETQPYVKETLGRAFRRIVADAALESTPDDPNGVTFHTLRHTFASWLVMSGTDLYTVSQLLGHSKIDLVEKTYGHLSPNHKRMAVDRLERAYHIETSTEAQN